MPSLALGAGLVSGGSLNEMKRWSLLQLMHVVPTVSAIPKFAFPLTFFLFTLAVSVTSSTVRNVAILLVQNVAH